MEMRGKLPSEEFNRLIHSQINLCGLAVLQTTRKEARYHAEMIIIIDMSSHMEIILED